ncbi:glycosyltransferase [Cupriavidus necator]|uniref:glycosyltransferase n=1 Tax=Cupriavidus necator TaxID=106590 RepID=UPI00339D7A22
MKIVHICETLKGGIESYLAELVPFQVERYGSENVHLIVPREGLSGADEAMFSATTWRFERNGRSPRAFLEFAKFIVSVVDKEAPDIVHLHSTFAGAFGRLTLLAFGRRKPIIYCPHGWSFARKGVLPINWLWRAIERILARACQRIVCISKHEYNLALNAGIPVSKLELISSGVSDISNNVGSPFSVGEPEGSAVRLLYVGRLDYQKGIDLLFDALGSVQRDDIELTIIGEPVLSSRWWDNVRSKAPKNVVMTGWKERAELDHYYGHAHALVMPSRWEGFGLVAVEALRSGTPVLCNTAGALPDIVEDGVSGYHINFENIRETISFFSRMTVDELIAMRKDARDKYIREFTSTRMNERTLAMYQSVSEQLEDRN